MRNRWTIWDELRKMQDEMDSLFDLSVSSNTPLLTGPKQEITEYSSPLCDVLEKENEMVYILDMPGFEKKDINIEIVNDKLIVKTHKKEELKREAEGYLRYERSYGGYKRVFNLPENLDKDKVNATYKNGVLEITLRKKEESKKDKKIINVD